MQIGARLTAVAMLTLSGTAVADSTAPAMPPGRWEVLVCESIGSAGSRCARLDQTRKLQVRYTVGPADIGKVLFERTLSSDEAEQLFARGLSVVRSFGDTPPGTVITDGTDVIIRVMVNGHAAEVRFSQLADPDSVGPEMRKLTEFLREITHAF